MSWLCRNVTAFQEVKPSLSTFSSSVLSLINFLEAIWCNKVWCLTKHSSSPLDKAHGIRCNWVIQHTSTMKTGTDQGDQVADKRDERGAGDEELQEYYVRISKLLLPVQNYQSCIHSPPDLFTQLTNFCYLWIFALPDIFVFVLIFWHKPR